MPSHPSDAPRPTTSAAVYRRRRLVVGVAALLALLLTGIALGALISRGLGGGAAEPAPSSAAPSSGEAAPSSDAPSPAPPPSGEASSASAAPSTPPPPFPDPALADLPVCGRDDLRLTASTDAGEYPAGEGEALLRLGVTNLSSADCRLDVGTAQQEFAVGGPGGEAVFTTRTCQEEPTHQEMRLEPHEEQRAVYRWDVRTTPAACGQQGAPPAPGSHTLTVTLGDLTSRPVAFRVVDSAASSAAASASTTATPSAKPSASAAPSSNAPATPAPKASAKPSPATSPAKRSATPGPAPTATKKPAPTASAKPSPATSPAAPSASPTR